MLENEQHLSSANSDSILFNNFVYEWYAELNNNPSLFYNGIENYSYIGGGNLFQCDEEITFQYLAPDNDQRDVNNLTRYFPTSSYWGDDKHDWVWIFKNTTLSTKDIPIAIFEAGTPESDHLFNVTGDNIINLDGDYYNVWVLEDDEGSIANYEKDTGILINGTFIFGGSQTWTIRMTNTNAEIPTNDNVPTLTNPSVSPTIGNLTTEFSFTVNYSDLDNNLPSSINVIINNTVNPMYKANISDVNYIDGVVYEYRSFLLIGSYQFYFNASDGFFTTSTSIFSGPNAYYNNSFSPTLTSSSVFPLLGYNTSTQFKYWVMFADEDNNHPKFVNITINDITYSMIQEDIADNNYINGAFFTYTTIHDEPGQYTYNFTASDGENTVTLPNVGFYHNPNVTLHNLNGVDIGWITTHGETTNLTYSTFLNNAVMLGATSNVFDQEIVPNQLYQHEILIVEEEGDSWTLQELNVLKNWVENGGRLLIIGDNRDNAQESISNHFNVKYSDYNGDIGISDQILQPHYLTVEVDSINFGLQRATIDLSNSNPLLKPVVNSSDGDPQVCLLELGLGKVLWILDEIVENSQIIGDNSIFGLNALRWMGKTRVNENVPILSNPNYMPSSGDSMTSFNFTIEYTDLDNVGPIYMNITLNDRSYQMTKLDSNDFNYQDGVIYIFTTTLQNGTTNYHFNASDGVTEVQTPVTAGPDVTYSNIYDPQLTSGGVSPQIGFTHTVFRFQVNYSDIDNNAPKFVSLVLDGIPYPMHKKDSQDNYYIDGVIYEYETTLLSGAYEFYFNASDAERSTYTSETFGPIVYSSPLKNIKIAWIRTHGESSNSSYTKILDDARNLGADVVTFDSAITNTSLKDFDIIVVNDGGTAWTNEELNHIEKWVINGSSILILGDERDSSQISLSQKFNVTYSSQSGVSGNSTQILCEHAVTFGLSNIYFPYPESTISSSSNIYLSPLINDRNGNLIVASLQYGSGRLLWVSEDSLINTEIDKVDNNFLSNNTWIWLANTSDNYNAPIISNAGVNPSNGDSRTLFQFHLDYSDPDGSGPIFVKLTINNTSYFLTKQLIDNFNYSTSVVYNLTIQLSPGTYNYYFNVSDGKFNSSFPIGSLELNVTSVNLSPPSLISTEVIPYLQFGEPGKYTFQTTYIDLDNAPPDYVRISIDNVEFDMIKLVLDDNSYYDGVTYQFEADLNLGYHNYSILAYDGIYTVNDPSSGKYYGPIVIEKFPLESKKIGWIRSHAEDNYLMYTIFLNDAVDLGATYEVISEVITSSILNEFDIIIVGEGGYAWSVGELAVLKNWVSSGHTLLLMGDSRDNSLVSVSNTFNVEYKEYSDSLDYTSNLIQPHTLTNGINSIYTYPYTAIDESSVPSGLVKLIRDKNGELIVATLIYGSGTVTWICDDNILDNSYIGYGNNRLFGNNTWLWSLTAVPTTPPPEWDPLLFIIITTSSVGVAAVVSAIFIMRRKKVKAKRLIENVVDEIQSSKE